MTARRFTVACSALGVLSAALTWAIPSWLDHRALLRAVAARDETCCVVTQGPWSA